MIKRFLPIALTVILATSGCLTLLPSAKQSTLSPWESFDNAKAAFDKIVPYSTTKAELKALGFDPFSTANIQILTYLDIMNHFMPNPSIKKDDLYEGIRACIDAREGCVAYKMEPKIVKTGRHGSVLLDLLNFKRHTIKTGWKFEALVVLIDGTVVYKLWGGNPMIDESEEVKRPLGPLQDADVILGKAVR